MAVEPKKNGLLARLRPSTSDQSPDDATASQPEIVEQQTNRAMNVRPAAHTELTIFIVAGEHSGDALGAPLMRELTRRRKGQVRFLGVGGPAMEAAGLTSLFPLDDIAIMGPAAILKALPRLTNRVYRTVAAGVAANPDVIVIIDSPEFTHRVARRLSRKLPGTPIIDYVCPSVWAWRPGRARSMARFIDHVLALLPFEPTALERLNGPPATYVGHPLSERLPWIQSIDVEKWANRFGLDRHRIPLVVLPGSRRSEIETLMPVYRETICALRDRGYECTLLMPVVGHHRARIEKLSADWPMRRVIIEDEEGKFAAFRLARAALAASGTVTLELAISGTPMVVTYRVDGLAARFRFLIKVESVVLANLVLGENAFPEHLQQECEPGVLSNALIEIFEDGPARAAQQKALNQIAEIMRPPPASASVQAADVVARYAADDTTIVIREE